MLRFLIRRSVYMLLTIVLVSMVAFILIQLPPGDFLTSYIADLEASGGQVPESEIVALKRMYGLDRPITFQYLRWIWNIISKGDFGRSFQWSKPVSELIWERFTITVVMSLSAMLFTIVVAIPIGIYSALNQYTIADFSFTFVGYIGLATPPFLFALSLMYIGHKVFGASVGGLFSPDFIEAPWSIARVLDMLSHLWIPVIVLGTAGTAALIRIMRSMLLDELRKQYVVTARAKGQTERKVIFRYPVRIALNPVISTLGLRLATIISGAPIVAVVLSLPTTGPLLLRSLLSQDMYLAGSFFLLLSTFTVFGTFVSDIVLAAMDPRIRME